jgi:hypothetical protein
MAKARTWAYRAFERGKFSLESLEQIAAASKACKRRSLVTINKDSFSK